MNLPRLLRSLTAALLLVSVVPGTSLAEPKVPKFDAFYVFGDSLVDVGNVWLVSGAVGITPAPPPSVSPNLTYFNGRFSNGPVVVEYLWELLSGHAPGSAGGVRPYLAQPLLGAAGAVDFAFGGTGTPALDLTPGGLPAPGLAGQIELFSAALAGQPPSKKALYLVMTGANDYRNDAYNVPMSPADVVANISASVQRLHALGARDVLVLTLPDLGQLPYLTMAQAAQGTAVTRAHNALLSQTIASLSASLPKARLRLIDANVVFASLRNTMNAQLPALDALLPPIDPVTPVPMSACLFVNPSACQDVPGGQFDVQGAFVFWDVVHPTTDAHRALAEYLYDQLRRR